VTIQNITAEEYEKFRTFLENSSGIVLGDNKHYLVTSRLTRLMKEFSIPSFSELLQCITKNTVLRQRIMDAMTTNETSWFRDSYPYDILKEKIFPELAKNKPKEIKIWSAACSSGQEPYSISMMASEFTATNPGMIPIDAVQIVATDISSTVLKSAISGVYEGLAVSRGLPQDRKKRFFKENNSSWEVIPEIKKRIIYREMNLMQSYTLLGKFDVIYCRNVLIYFSTKLKKDIMYRMAKALKPNGYLILGGSETISGYSDDFDLIKWKSGVVYQLKKK